METETRRCCRCKAIKAISEFHIDRSKRYGRRHHCRVCQNEYQSSYGLRHQSKIADWNRAGYKRNRLRRLFYAARARAKINGLEFSIAQSDIAIPKFCPVLNTPIDLETIGQTPNSPSVDRIDNAKGYIPGNVVVISWRANRLKSDSTLDELHKLIAWLESIGHGS